MLSNLTSRMDEMSPESGWFSESDALASRHQSHSPLTMVRISERTEAAAPVNPIPIINGQSILWVSFGMISRMIYIETPQ